MRRLACSPAKESESWPYRVASAQSRCDAAGEPPRMQRQHGSMDRFLFCPAPAQSAVPCPTRGGCLLSGRRQCTEDMQVSSRGGQASIPHPFVKFRSQSLPDACVPRFTSLSGPTIMWVPPGLVPGFFALGVGLILQGTHDIQIGRAQIQRAKLRCWHQHHTLALPAHVRWRPADPLGQVVARVGLCPLDIDQMADKTHLQTRLLIGRFCRDSS